MKNKWLTHKMLPWFILSMGLIIAVLLASSEEELIHAPSSSTIPTVETIEAARQDYQLILKGFGSLKARETIRMISQVSGRIMSQNPLLENGNYLEKGTPLFQIDTADYTIALNKAQAELDKARKALELEKGQQLIARKEWELLDGETKKLVKSPALALRTPQLQATQAEIAAAKSNYDQAKLNLARTGLSAPCNGVVLQENVAVGNLVNTSDVIITFACSEYYSVETAIPMSHIAYLDLPKAGTTTNGIIIRNGPVTRKAILSALLPTVEQNAQMARLLIHVKNPLAHPPLLLDAHVEAEIPARMLNNIFVIPETALRADNTLWLLTPQNTLEIRTISPLTTNQGKLLLRDGLKAGEKVIVSMLGLPVAGMELREVAP